MKVRHLRRRTYRKKGGPPNIGLRCKDYYEGCIICNSYAFYDLTGRLPTFEEARLWPSLPS